MQFDLSRPCGHGNLKCPFRTDCTPQWLGEARAREIASAVLLHDQTFECHKTAHGAAEAQHCAGALLLSEAYGRPNAMHQIAARLGLWNPDRLDHAAPVFRDADQFIRHHARTPDPAPLQLPRWLKRTP